MSTQLWWYAARSGGIVAWATLSASVLWGLMLSGKLRPGQVRPNWMLDLHRYLGALATVFTAIHVASIAADSYTDFGVADVLVPFASSWHPGPVAWGIVGMYLLVAVEATSLARKHLPRSLWKRTHFLSFPLWLTATVHLLTAGTERSNPILLAAAGTVTVAVAALTLWRITASVRTGDGAATTGASPRRSAAPVSTVAAAARTVVPAGPPAAPQHPTVADGHRPPMAAAPPYPPAAPTHPYPPHPPSAPPPYTPGVPPPYVPR